LPVVIKAFRLPKPHYHVQHILLLSSFSASAERALSKLKIVKNRLRSSLCDDMLSALLILSSEKDLLAELSNISIIHRLASASSSLKAHLQYM
jgi:hypothetical protein